MPNVLLCQIGDQLMMVLRSIGDFENHVISIERIKEYSQIQTEVGATTKFMRYALYFHIAEKMRYESLFSFTSVHTQS